MSLTYRFTCQVCGEVFSETTLRDDIPTPAHLMPDCPKCTSSKVACGPVSARVEFEPKYSQPGFLSQRQAP